MKLNIFIKIVVFLAIVFLISCGSSEVDKARDYMEASMYYEAIQLLEIEIQANPKNTEAHFLIGKCYFYQNNNYNSEESFDRAILIDSDYREIVANLYLEVAIAEIKKENLSVGFEYLERAVEKNPSNKSVIARKIFDLGTEIAGTTKNTASIEEIFNKAAKIDTELRPTIAGECYRLAESMMEKGFDEAGLRYAEKSISLDPKYIKDVAKIYYEQGKKLAATEKDYYKVIKSFDRAIELNKGLNKDVAEYLHKLAKEKVKEGNEELAIIYAKRSSELNPVFEENYQKIYKSSKFYDFERIIGKWEINVLDQTVFIDFKSDSTYYGINGIEHEIGEFHFQKDVLLFKSLQKRKSGNWRATDDRYSFKIVFVNNNEITMREIESDGQLSQNEMGSLVLKRITN